MVVAAALVVVVPLAAQVPALGTLALPAALTVGLIVFEAVRFADVRDRVRHAGEVAVSEIYGRDSD